MYTQLFQTWNVLLRPLFSDYSSRCFPNILTSLFSHTERLGKKIFYTYGRTYTRPLQKVALNINGIKNRQRKRTHCTTMFYNRLNPSPPYFTGHRSHSLANRPATSTIWSVHDTYERFNISWFLIRDHRTAPCYKHLFTTWCYASTCRWYYCLCIQCHLYQFSIWWQLMEGVISSLMILGLQFV